MKIQKTKELHGRIKQLSNYNLEFLIILLMRYTHTMREQEVSAVEILANFN
jgi:hypothetical protein